MVREVHGSNPALGKKLHGKKMYGFKFMTIVCSEGDIDKLSTSAFGSWTSGQSGRKN